MSEAASQSGESWRPGRPPRTIGPYLVERELGAGRMGTVFLARHPEVDARYAIKVLAADLLDAKDVLRFQREVELLAAAPRHPGLVRVHAAGQERGRSYFVMEFVEGQTLQQVIGKRAVDPRAAARWTRELAEALAALHAVGIIHRDIKPANILIDPQGRARLADFGLARQLGDGASRLTRTGEVMGTPQYMAPEQALGLEEVGPPTDVYALGMVLYALLSGSPAVAGGSMLDILQRVSTGELRPLAETAPDAPPELGELIELALSMEPARRPTAAELAARLDLWLREGRAGGARPRGTRALLLLALVAVAAAVAAPLARRARTGAGAAAATTAEVAALATRLWAPDLGATGAAELSSAAEALAARGGDQVAALLLVAGEAALRAGEPARARALREQARAANADPREARPLDLGLAALGSGVTTLEAEAATELVPDALARRPGRPDVRAWAFQAAARAGGASAARIVDTVPAEGVPPALRAEALLAAGRLAQAAAVASGAHLGPALERRLAWSLASAAIAAVAKEITAATIDDLERALERLEALPPAVGPPPAEQGQVLGAAQKLLRTRWRTDSAAPPELLARLLRLHIAAHTLWRLAEPTHRASPAPELLASTLPLLGDSLSPFIRGRGGRRRMARAIALAPDDLNAYLMALDLAVRRTEAPPAPEPVDLEADVAWFDRAIELCEVEDDVQTLYRHRADHLARAGEVERLAASCDLVARRWGTRKPELAAHLLEQLSESLRRRGDLPAGVAALRSASATNPEDLRLASRASALTIQAAKAPGASEAERTAALAEAEALQANARFDDAFFRLKHAEATAEALLDWRGDEGARRAISVLRGPMAGYTRDQLTAPLILLRALLKVDADVSDPALSARWSAAIDDLAPRLAGDAAYQEQVAPTLVGQAQAWSLRRAKEVREHAELTIPELRADLRRGDVHTLVLRAHSVLGPRPGPAKGN